MGDSIPGTKSALSTVKNGVSRAGKPRSGPKTEMTLHGTTVLRPRRAAIMYNSLALVDPSIHPLCWRARSTPVRGSGVEQ